MPTSQISAIYQRGVNTKSGKMDVYSVYLQAENGAIGSGFDPEIRSVCKTLQKGDWVEYVTRKNNKGYVEFETVRKVPQTKTSAPANSQEDRQEAIMRQSTLGYATNIVASTLRKGDNLSHAAEEAIRIANQYFMPYVKGELDKNFEEEMEEENNQTQDQQEVDPNDDVPF